MSSVAARHAERVGVPEENGGNDMAPQGDQLRVLGIKIQRAVKPLCSVEMVCMLPFAASQVANRNHAPAARGLP